MCSINSNLYIEVVIKELIQIYSVLEPGQKWIWALGLAPSLCRCVYFWSPRSNPEIFLRSKYSWLPNQHMQWPYVACKQILNAKVYILICYFSNKNRGFAHEKLLYSFGLSDYLGLSCYVLFKWETVSILTYLNNMRKNYLISY